MSNKTVYGTGTDGHIYSSWLKCANERDVLEDVLRKRSNEWLQSSPLSMLEVGCGTGAAAKRLFKVLDEHNVQIQYTGIEPRKEQLELFQNTSTPSLSIELIESTLESFQSKQIYDLGIIVHSLYYVDSMEETIKKLRSLTQKQLIVHHGKRGINEIHQEFKEFVPHGPHLISTIDDVCKSLDKINIQYHREVYPTEVDVRPCHDPRNADGRNLIRFFLQRPDVSEDQIQEISNYFRSRRIDTMIHDMGVIITNASQK